MADKLSVSDSVTKVYQSARDGCPDLTNLLKLLKTEQRKTALETKTKDGGHFVTPLIIAAHNGHLNSVKILLGYRADIEARGTLKIDDKVSVEGCTPLFAAAATGYLDVVKLLIERNADVDGRTKTGSTPLRAAVHEGHLDIVRCLVESGAYVNARNKYKGTPMMAACDYGHLSIVTYLINKGAFMDLQDKHGYTALHHAAEMGHFEIVRQLLALGASQLPNNQGLTPLFLACDKRSIEIVEYLIKRPECTKEQRIDALELLGATIANDKPRDTENAFSYLKRGMEERYEDPVHPLLKKKMEPVEAYQNRKESQTLEELALLEGDGHALGMEGLVIRERILGSDNPVLRFPIRYRGAVLADSGQYELCIGLWQRAMEKAFNCDVPIKEVTSDIESFADLFGEMVNKNKLLRPHFIEDAFEILVTASEKLTENSPEGDLGHGNEEQKNTLYYALYHLMIYTKVKAQHPSKVNRFLQKFVFLDPRTENASMIDFLQRFLRLNPRTNDGNTLLHLAAWHETPIKEDNVRKVCKLPCVETMKLILHAGGDVNAVNTEGNTPLHLAVTFRPNGPEEVVILSEMLLLLLDIGADPKLENKNGQTPLDSCQTDEARMILSEKGRLSAKNVDVRDVS